MAERAPYPSYPDAPDPGDEAPAGRRRPRWTSAATAALVVAGLAVMIVLHLTGVLGAGSH